MKEKKLSKEMLLEELRAMAICNELYLRGKKQRTRWNEIKNSDWFKRRIQAYHQIHRFIEEQTEPSEAEVEEFIEKWTSKMSVAFYESNIMHSIKQLLQEYDQFKKLKREDKK